MGKDFFAKSSAYSRVLLSSSSQPNKVLALTETPGKTCFTASFIVCATQQEPATQADKGGFECMLLDVMCGLM